MKREKVIFIFQTERRVWLLNKEKFCVFFVRNKFNNFKNTWEIDKLFFSFCFVYFLFSFFVLFFFFLRSKGKWFIFFTFFVSFSMQLLYFHSLLSFQDPSTSLSSSIFSCCSFHKWMIFRRWVFKALRSTGEIAVRTLELLCFSVPQAFIPCNVWPFFSFFSPHYGESRIHNQGKCSWTFFLLSSAFDEYLKR